MQVEEGRAKIKFSDGTFYNPNMRGLRDISVLFLKAVGKRRYSLLDATSATGIRGIRYALEASAGKTTYLDMNKKAYSDTKLNVKRNKLKGTILNQDIQEFANSSEESFDVIDLDPFGSVAPYVYDLMKVAKDGTILMATATDAAVLCGAHYSACLKIYASQPLNNELCQEVGTRILINFIARIAAQLNFGIEVKLAISNLHYMRVFLVLRHGAENAVESIKQTGFGAFCSKCRAFYSSKGLAPKLNGKCANCGAETIPFGPIWLGNIYDHALLRKMKMLMPKGMEKNAAKLLRTVDLELDTPFFYSIPKLTRYLGISSVPRKRVLDKLGKKYEVSETHFDPDGIKTDAPIKKILESVKGAAT